MEYNVGNRVKIKPWADLRRMLHMDSEGDLVANHSVYFVRPMRRYCDKKFKIERIVKSEYDAQYVGYKLEGAPGVGQWVFTKEMFVDEPKTKPIKDNYVFKEDRL